MERAICRRCDCDPHRRSGRASIDDVERKLQEAGTYHVIAISGGNIAILAGLCMLLLHAAGAGPRLSALRGHRGPHGYTRWWSKAARRCGEPR